jgi:hypothetical protein
MNTQVNPSSPRLHLPLIAAKSLLAPSVRPKLGLSPLEREDMTRSLAQDPVRRDAFAAGPGASFPGFSGDIELMANGPTEDADHSACTANAVCALNAAAIVNVAVVTNVVVVNAVESAVVAHLEVAVIGVPVTLRSDDRAPLRLPSYEEAV